MESLQESLDFFSDDVKGFKDDLEEKLSHVDHARDKEQNKIVQMEESMKFAIQAATDKLTGENHTLFLKYKDYLEKSLQAVTQLEREITAVSSQADDILTSGTSDRSSADHVMSKYNSMQDRLATLQKGVVQPVFHPTEEDLLVVKGMEIGKFEQTETLNAPPITGFPTQRTGLDMNPCFLTGLLWVNNIFVVSDKANKRVKFFTEGGQFLGELMFTNALPYGICHMTGHTFAVTLPKVRQIYFARLGNGKADVISSFQTMVGYAGLSKYDENSLLTSMASNTPGESHVDIIGFRGEVFKSFHNDPVLRAPLFKFPRFITSFQGVLIISDWRKDCVIFLHAATGSILKEYRGTAEHHLVNPYDITLDSRGNVYILNGKDGTVHVLDLQCNLIDVIKETSELLNPRLIAYNDAAGLLAVTHGAGDIQTFYHVVPAPVSVQPENTSNNSPSFLSPPKPNFDARCPSPGF